MLFNKQYKFYLFDIYKFFTHIFLWDIPRKYDNTSEMNIFGFDGLGVVTIVRCLGLPDVYVKMFSTETQNYSSR